MVMGARRVPGGLVWAVGTAVKSAAAIPCLRRIAASELVPRCARVAALAAPGASSALAAKLPKAPALPPKEVDALESANVGAWLFSAPASCVGFGCQGSCHPFGGCASIMNTLCFLRCPAAAMAVGGRKKAAAEAVAAVPVPAALKKRGPGEEGEEVQRHKKRRKRRKRLPKG